MNTVTVGMHKSTRQLYKWFFLPVGGIIILQRVQVNGSFHDLHASEKHEADLVDQCYY